MHPHEYDKRVESGKSEQDKLIAAKQYGNVEIVARILGVSVSYLNKARMSGDGPPYVKFGRNVRYSIPEVLAWAEARARMSTSDSGEAA
jgi:predicted DNA-binding transcriptional regulator AlpA